ncbi:MAG: bifunctional UDP-sugar hydrolase/5'-nucleotidase [Polyangiales bacterium]
MIRALVLALGLVAAGCAPRALVRAPSAPRRVTLSIVGTSDLHGRLAALPWLAGHVRNLRAARARDGAVLLLDAGDMFQGTLESNLNEGAAVIRAYNALGYAAAAVGNHEFDYGPAGDPVGARRREADPQGALRARAREARFPLLSANLVDPQGRALGWENVRPSILLDLAGVRVGVLGLSTESTVRGVGSGNTRGVALRPLAGSLRAEAAALRAAGADVVLAVAHAGGRCTRFDDPHDLASCDPEQELFRALREAPEGVVDVVVAGHTHQGVAHVVRGAAVIESFANGRAFGRVDLTVDLDARRVVQRRVHPPRHVCGEGATDADELDLATCAPTPYEGAAVRPDDAVAGVIAPDLERARAARSRPVGVRVVGAVRTGYREEAALPNLVADLLRAATPGADVGLMNAGGVRVDLPAGALDEGALYAVMPFDNRLLRVRLRAAGLRAVLARNAGGRSGTLALSGLRAEVTCEAGAARVTLRRDGEDLPDAQVLTVATHDFLARGPLAEHLLDPLDDDAVDAAPTLRDALRAQLAALGELRGDDPRWFDPARPRMALPGPRPVRCGAPP